MDNSTLFQAIRDGEFESVNGYFSDHPERVNEKNLEASSERDNWDELTPIHSAAKFGRLDIVRRLVELGSEVYSHPTNTYPAVILAAWQGHEHVVDYFLREIPEKAEGTHQLGVTINLAGRQGWLDIVERHVARDPLAVHQRGWIGDSPLHWPAHNGYQEIVRYLLVHGADPNAEEVNWIGGTPLHWASERHASIVRLLVEYGADVNARVTRPGSHHLGATPLIWCAKQRDDAGDVAACLLELGADPELKDTEGKRAIDYAKANVAAVLAA